MKNTRKNSISKNDITRKKLFNHFCKNYYKKELYYFDEKKGFDDFSKKASKKRKLQLIDNVIASYKKNNPDDYLEWIDNDIGLFLDTDEHDKHLEKVFISNLKEPPTLEGIKNMLNKMPVFMLYAMIGREVVLFQKEYDEYVNKLIY